LKKLGLNNLNLERLKKYSQEESLNLEDNLINAGLSYKEGFTEEDADPEELKMGIEVEYEHTDSREISKKIALDHLAEIPDYYTRLKKMEEEALKEIR
jgi:hypothetical protein